MGDLLYCNFYFVIHTTCYCMDAIHLNGNVWINIPLRSGKQVSDRHMFNGEGKILCIYILV